MSPIPAKILRDLRKANDLTLAYGSQLTGVAVSTLSKIENNQTSPSYNVLIKLADGLGVDFVDLINGGTTRFGLNCRIITRAGEGKHYTSQDGAYEALGSELTNKAMEPMVVRISVRNKPSRNELVKHIGEELMYVLEGTIEIYTEYYEPTIMNAGDSIYFDSSMGHYCVSISEQDALILSVCFRRHSTGYGTMALSE